jgi:flagellar hook-basal body complex protein FliE
MALLDPSQVAGSLVNLVRTDPRHLAGAGDAEPAAAAGGVEGDFGQLLMKALGGVNDSQLTAMDLSQKAFTDPSSVNVEDVTIALANASLALSMTKSIVDRALAAYREIINTR